MTLNQLRDEAAKVTKVHRPMDATPERDIARMHVELSKAVESIMARKALAEHWYTYKFSGDPKEYPEEPDRVIQYHSAGDRNDWEIPIRVKPAGVPSHLASVVILVLQFCAKHGIDIERAVAERLAYEATPRAQWPTFRRVYERDAPVDDEASRDPARTK